MKANDVLDDTKWKGWVLPSAYEALARYFVKFIQAYARRGVPIAAVAPQNEPQAPAPYPSSAFPEQNEAQWILDDLQPAIQAAGLPTRIYGGCAGVITVDQRRHKVTFGLGDYQLAQVSRFVAPGATPVASNQFVSYYYRSSRAYGVTPGLDDVTLVNPNQSHVLVAYNNSSAPNRFAGEWLGRSFVYRLAPKATVTFD